MKCPQCGRRLKADWPDKERWFNCDSCGDRFFIEDDGEVVNILHRRSRTTRTCINCGASLAGGEYIQAWEYGNEDPYILCPSCNCPNYTE